MYKRENQIWLVLIVLLEIRGLFKEKMKEIGEGLASLFIWKFNFVI